jgi:hypothetical protein
MVLPEQGQSLAAWSPVGLVYATTVNVVLAPQSPPTIVKDKGVLIGVASLGLPSTVSPGCGKHKNIKIRMVTVSDGSETDDGARKDGETR